MHMGAVVTFTPRGPVDPAALTKILADRAARLPKLRQRARAELFPPGSASWAEDAGLCCRGPHSPRRAELAVRTGPACGVRVAVDRRAARHRAGRCGTLTLATGLPDGKFALLLKLHHALTDGAGAYAVAAGLLDGVELPERTPAPARPIPAPRSTLDTVKDALGTVWGQANETAGIASSLVRAARPPLSPVSAPPSAERRLGFVRLPLAELRQVRRAHGGTTNDVVLAVLSGALREWLVNRGQRADGRTLRALIPVSVRGRRGWPARRQQALGLPVRPAGRRGRPGRAAAGGPPGDDPQQGGGPEPRRRARCRCWPTASRRCCTAWARARRGGPRRCCSTW